MLSKLLVASSWLVRPNNKWRLLAKLPKRERVRQEKRAKMQAEAAETQAKQPEKSKVERTPNGAPLFPFSKPLGACPKA